MFCGIFTQSFDAFWGHSNILKINCKAVSTTASSKNLVSVHNTAQPWTLEGAILVPEKKSTFFGIKALLKNGVFCYWENTKVQRVRSEP